MQKRYLETIKKIFKLNLFVKDLIKHTSTKEKIFILSIMFLGIIMGVLEMLKVSMLGPFIALVANQEMGANIPYLKSIQSFFNIDSTNNLILFLGIGFLIICIIEYVLNFIKYFFVEKIVANLSRILSVNLFNLYITKPFLFHLKHDSTYKINRIIHNIDRVASLYLNGLINLCSSIFFLLIITALLISLNPYIIVFILIVYGIYYLIVYLVYRKIIFSTGQIMTEVLRSKYKILQDAFSGIKDILLLGNKKSFMERYSETSQENVKTTVKFSIIQKIPPSTIFFINNVGLISIFLYITLYPNNIFNVNIEIMIIYGIASTRIPKQVSIVYEAFLSFKSNALVYKDLREDILDSMKVDYLKESNLAIKSNNKLSIPTQQISLNDIQFTYPNAPKPILKDFNITIGVNSVIGIAGPSGSGKSTLINILLGLIEPQKGNISIDNQIINKDNIQSWQRMLGHVPQSIYLSSSTIAENVAFGTAKENIDRFQVEKVLKLAHLDKLLEELPNGIDTNIGERGVRLSGGQRQRIGIARTLYYEPSIIILDEATSALDGITEKVIMDSIHDFSGKKTIIIIAHRLKTIQECDSIIFLDEGKIITQGKYDELVDTNELFRKMAFHHS